MAPKKTLLNETHKKMAIQALAACKGCRTAAALHMGISVRTMRNWINKFGLHKQFPSNPGKPISK